jgi:hypothetical protein
VQSVGRGILVGWGLHSYKFDEFDKLARQTMRIHSSPDIAAGKYSSDAYQIFCPANVRYLCKTEEELKNFDELLTYANSKSNPTFIKHDS